MEGQEEFQNLRMSAFQLFLGLLASFASLARNHPLTSDL